MEKRKPYTEVLAAGSGSRYYELHTDVSAHDSSAIVWPAKKMCRQTLLLLLWPATTQLIKNGQ